MNGDRVRSTQEANDAEHIVIATIIGAVLAVAVAGAGWIWREARRHRPSG
jgi:hypothetical protein